MLLSQVPQILNPVVLVLDELPRLATASAAAASYVNTAFGGVEAARHAVLLDFCRHAFDGSGADNFFDAGLCGWLAGCGCGCARWCWFDTHPLPLMCLSCVPKAICLPAHVPAPCPTSWRWPLLLSGAVPL
jgi:Protein of unknown function (DUF2009)